MGPRATRPSPQDTAISEAEHTINQANVLLVRRRSDRAPSLTPSPCSRRGWIVGGRGARRAARGSGDHGEGAQEIAGQIPISRLSTPCCGHPTCSPGGPELQLSQVHDRPQPVSLARPRAWRSPARGAGHPVRTPHGRRNQGTTEAASKRAPRRVTRSSSGTPPLLARPLLGTPPVPGPPEGRPIGAHSHTNRATRDRASSIFQFNGGVRAARRDADPDGSPCGDTASPR